MFTYYVYILSNKTKTVFYIDSTEHIESVLKDNFNNEFVTKFKTTYLVYCKSYPGYKQANDAKYVLRSSSRAQQEKEIRAMNPEFQFLDFTDKF